MLMPLCMKWRRRKQRPCKWQIWNFKILFFPFYAINLCLKYMSAFMNFSTSWKCLIQRLLQRLLQKRDATSPNNVNGSVLCSFTCIANTLGQAKFPVSYFYLKTVALKKKNDRLKMKKTNCTIILLETFLLCCLVQLEQMPNRRGGGGGINILFVLKWIDQEVETRDCTNTKINE